MVRERVDVLLTRRGLTPSRERARILIMAGEVFSGTERIARPDRKLPDDVPLEVRGDPIPFVSYGGVKLDHALRSFGIAVEGMTALDVGSSTGGFIDVLLKSGAAKVHAVDTGSHQLHERLRLDDRVHLREHCNARHLTFEDIGEQVDIITVDVSFISVRKILSALLVFLKPDGHLVTLIKPQFEVGRFSVGKGGIVKDEEKIRQVLEEVRAFGEDLGLLPLQMVEAPRERERKNREFFILWGLRKNRDQSGFLPA